MSIEKCHGYKLGFENAYKREMHERVDCENPFEPGYTEYDNYFDGLIEGKEQAIKDQSTIGRIRMMLRIK